MHKGQTCISGNVEVPEDPDRRGFNNSLTNKQDHNLQIVDLRFTHDTHFIVCADPCDNSLRRRCSLTHEFE